MAFSPIFLWIFVDLDNAVGLPQKAASQRQIRFHCLGNGWLSGGNRPMSMNAMWLTARCIVVRCAGGCAPLAPPGRALH